MMPSFTRQNENATNAPSYKKMMETVHGDVHEVNKTGLAKLNKKFKKKGKIDMKTTWMTVKFKNKIDMTNHKPTVKKKW